MMIEALSNSAFNFDLRRYTKVINPHWAEFYYMTMVLTETVVLILVGCSGVPQPETLTPDEP